MDFSSTSKVVGPLLARQLYMMAKKYDDVVDFTIGDPDVPTDKAICQAACDAAMNGLTRYSANAGIPELKEAISCRINNTRGTDYTADNIITTIGATEALYIAFMSLLNKDDEVIILAPYWIQYANMTKFFGAKPIIVDKFTHGLEPDLEAIRMAITQKTKIIVINSPNNPSGIVYGDSFLQGVARIAEEYSIFIFADEVYDALVYDKPYVSIAKYCKKELLVLFNSFSKAFAMTGWRVGYFAAGGELVKTAIKMHQNIAICAAVPSQYASLEAISHADDYSLKVREVFARRRATLIRELKTVPHIRYEEPAGTFYAFLDISDTRMDSKTFTFSLLEREHVAVIPGIAYGDAFDGYIRLAFTMNEETIIKGVARIRHFMEFVVE